MSEANKNGVFLSLYAALLRLCPSDFRGRFGADLLATISARESDWVGLTVAARQKRRARELWALVRNAYGLRGPHRSPPRSPRKGTPMQDLRSDLRHAVRRLARNSGFTVAAALTLALGIGASSAIFSLVNGILIQPLPYPEADRLVGIWHEAPGMNLDQIEVSDALYLNYRDHGTALEDVAIGTLASMNLTGDGEPIRIAGAEVTPTLFSVLQTEPLLGRAFTAEEGAPGAAPTVIISSSLWRSRFAADESVLGGQIRLDGVARQIVGVMPESFRYPRPDVLVWTPLVIDADELFGHNFSYRGVGRLRDGITTEQAEAEMTATLLGIVDRVPQQFPPELFASTGLAPFLTPLKAEVVGDVGEVLWVLLGIVGLVLLIACGNVANLFLVRADGRRREVALRTALGAGRWQLARLHLAESVVLAVLGGVAGLLLARGALALVGALDPGTLPRLEEVSIDGAVLAFAALLSLGSALVFGSFPSLRARAVDLVEALEDGGSGTTGGGARNRLRNLLVVAQVALALVLLVASGLMLRTFVALRNVDPGFDASNALSMRLSLPESDYAGYREMGDFVVELNGAIDDLPGVVAAGTSTRIGLLGGGDNNGVYIEDFPVPEGGLPFVHPTRVVSPGFFEAMGIPLIEGRVLERSDLNTGERVVVVSEPFARNYWPGQSPVGKRLRSFDGSDWHTIVGVVGGIRETGLEEDPGQTLYFPLNASRYARRTFNLVVRTDDNPTALLPAVRDTVWALDPNLPIAGVTTLERVVVESMARTTFATSMLVVAAVVALLLGSIGIYGVVAYIVGQRTAEIGVRMALGARADEVSTMVVRQGLLVVAVGIVLGTAGALALSRTMAALLFEVSPVDPVTFVVVPLLLVVIGVLACLLPARRAAAVDPAVALRSH